MARIYLFLIIVGFFGSLGYAARWYYMSTQESITTLTETNTTLDLASRTLNSTIVQMRLDARKNEQLNQNLTLRLQESQVHLDRLRTVLARIDLTTEALTNAQGLEDRVNRAVNRLIREISEETDPSVRGTNPTDSMQPTFSGTDSRSN